MATSRMADQVGRVLGGRYRLLAPIGTGASAAVFAADDVVLRRRVAVKVLHAALADDEAFLRRFRAEAQAVAALEHTNIVGVYDWGEDGGTPFLVLQLLRGGSLRNMLDAGHRLSPSQALVVGIETARALDYAHRRGLVHRDIKPANLLFNDDGRVCVADFGVARALAEAAWTEPAGAVLGTARYASPEQVQGSSVDGRTDVYALALVIIEAVTGQVPFAADTTIATLMGRLNNPLVAPEELGPLVPAIEMAGRSDPALRVDAAGFAQALDRAARTMPEPDRLPLVGSIELDDDAAENQIDLTVLPVGRPAPAFHQESRPRQRDEPRRIDRAYDYEQEYQGTGSEPSRTSFDADDDDRGVTRRRRRWPWAVLAAIVLLAAGAAGAFALVQADVPSHPVPTVNGKTVADAELLAKAEHFKVKVAREDFSETADPGRILEQNPLAGQKLKEGKDVSVVVSKGPAPREIPDLTPLDEAAVTQKLTDAGLNPKIDHQNSETIPKGAIIGWSPKGTVPKGTEVDVVVSLGPAPVPLSDWAGHTFDEFAANLAKVQVKALRNDVFSDTVPAGKIISTTPPPGTPIPKDGTGSVTATVSKGFAPIPNVAGKSVTDATNILNGAGYQVVGVNGPPNHAVSGTNPPAGTPAKKGTQVTLITS